MEKIYVYDSLDVKISNWFYWDASTLFRQSVLAIGNEEKIFFIQYKNNFVSFEEFLVNHEKVGYLLTWSQFGSSEVEPEIVSIWNSEGVGISHTYFYLPTCECRIKSSSSALNFHEIPRQIQSGDFHRTAREIVQFHVFARRNKKS